MINYQIFPQNVEKTEIIKRILDCFSRQYDKISSESHALDSLEVLDVLSNDLISLEFNVQTGNARNDRIFVPVLFSPNNQVKKSFSVNAISSDKKIVIEIEAGRALTNNQFLEDICHTSMMYCVECLILAVRNEYRNSHDYLKILDYLDTLFLNNRIKIPLKSIVLIGY